MQHLDDGTIHAWLDGELSADEAERIAVHAGKCVECGALVAEARGLIAASTRILTALDDVPAGVMPNGSVVSEKPVAAGEPIFRHRWYDRTDLRAAAALLFVAGASLVAVKIARNPASSVKAVAAPMGSSVAVSPPLQDTATPAAADVAQQAKASEVKPMVGGAGVFAEQARSEGRVAVSPPTVASKVSAREPVSAPVMAKAMDAVNLSKAMGNLRSDAPTPGRVQGQVVDGVREKGLPAASVQVEGTTLGAITDQQGRFTIDSVPAGDRRLLVRRIGYVAQAVPLAVREESGATATVALAPSTTKLDEVVVSSIAAGPTATAGSAAPLRVLRTDSTANTRRVVYQISPSVEVTLVESAINAVERDRGVNQPLKDKMADSAALRGSLSGVTPRSNAKTDRAAAPAPMVMSASARPQINTISWSDLTRRYTLSGPLKPSELEAIKERLMKMRR
jgi:hypothetical protein